MKIDISVDCTYSRCAIKQFVENADAMEVFRYALNAQLLGKLYKDDGRSYDIACEIAECVGFNNFLKHKHTYDELVEYYNNNCCEDNIEEINIPPEETALLSRGTQCVPVQETVQETVQKTKKPLLEGHISGNYKIIDDTKQTKDVIEMSKEKRAALLKKKPNVKCDL